MKSSRVLLARVYISAFRRWGDLLDRMIGARARIHLWILGVEYGSGLRFHGAPIVSVRPGSELRIGANCKFRSSSRGNAIGVNHPVVLRTLSAGAKLRIGDGLGMSGGAICALGQVTIGSRVLLGANVVVSDSDFHPLDASERSQGLECGHFKPVVIADDVWIGADAYVCKGVTIGRGAIVGAHAVVTHDVAPWSVVAGNPARLIRQITAPATNSTER